MKQNNRMTQILLGFLCLLIILCMSLSGCTMKTDVGVSDMTINENGELIVKLSDGKEQNLGVVVGKDGADGINGAPGVKGDPGTAGADGKDGSDGMDGKDGINGKDGSDGKDGDVSIQLDEDVVKVAASLGMKSAVKIVSGFDVADIYGLQGKVKNGAGVIYELDQTTGSAFIVTNYHVVHLAESIAADGISDDIRVYLYGSEYANTALNATYVGGSAKYDLAVLRVENESALKADFLREVKLPASRDVVVGQTAIAIGNPDGDGISVTSGVVSVDSEEIRIAPDDVNEVSMRVMRIDTPVNSGNSGGGLFNSQGELIGIVNAKTGNADMENIGYAIPLPVVCGVAENIIDHCYGKSNESVKLFQMNLITGVSASKAVFDVESGSAFIEEEVVLEAVDVEGLQAYDQLVSLSVGARTQRITREYQYKDFLLTLRAGDTLTIKVMRSGSERTVQVPVTALDMILA